MWFFFEPMIDTFFFYFEIDHLLFRKKHWLWKKHELDLNLYFAIFSLCGK